VEELNVVKLAYDLVEEDGGVMIECLEVELV